MTGGKAAGAEEEVAETGEGERHVRGADGKNGPRVARRKAAAT